jgi:demethylmenaquinone methyltransferase / 2-methoxy-6-polyprenyl-1,4-benzoquinol methylase
MFTLSRKGEQIQAMFGSIASRYDLLNKLLSFGVDTRWRRFAVSLVRSPADGYILDIATGTGDMALEIAEATPSSVSIIGIDFCKEMIEIAALKAERSIYAERINYAIAPCEAVPFPDGSFDSVTIAFGIRNLDNRIQGLREMYRILKTGGRVIILEFSTPRSKIIKIIYHWYFCRLLPIIGGLFSRFDAYKYLPDSVLEFPAQAEFKHTMTDAGFLNPIHYTRTFGIVSIYLGEK